MFSFGGIQRYIYPNVLILVKYRLSTYLNTTHRNVYMKVSWKRMSLGL